MGEESSYFGEGLKDNVRETKKVFVSGPMMKPEKKELYVAYLNKIAGEVGGGRVEDCKSMSPDFVFDDFLKEGYRAYGATIVFDHYMGAVKLVNEYNGKIYDDHFGLEIFRVNRDLNLDQILEKLGVPIKDMNPFLYTNGILSGIFVDPELSAVQLTGFQEAIKEKLKKIKPFDEIILVNITKELNLPKKSKDAWIALIEFNSHEIATTALYLYHGLEIENRKVNFKLIDMIPDTEDLLGYIGDEDQEFPDPVKKKPKPGSSSSRSPVKKPSRPKRKPSKPLCLQVDLKDVIMDDIDKVQQYVRRTFGDHGQLGCMRRKCTNCMDYCLSPVFMKSMTRSWTDAAGAGPSYVSFQVFFKTIEDIEKSKAANFGMVTPYGTLNDGNMTIVEYNYEDTDQSESESEDEIVEPVEPKGVPKKHMPTKKQNPNASSPKEKGWHIKLVINNTVKSLAEADNFTSLIRKHFGKHGEFGCMRQKCQRKCKICIEPIEIQYTNGHDGHRVVYKIRFTRKDHLDKALAKCRNITHSFHDLSDMTCEEYEYSDNDGYCSSEESEEESEEEGEIVPQKFSEEELKHEVEVVIFLPLKPSDLFTSQTPDIAEHDKFEYNMEELAKIKPFVESIGLIEDNPDEELLFPKPGSSREQLLMKFTFERNIDAKRFKRIKLRGFDQLLETKYTKEVPELMASYTYKPQDEISSKAQKTRVQANLRNDLKRVHEEYEQEGRFNEAINQYKFIFSEAMGKDLQNIASDAEALKVGIKITKGNFTEAIDDIKDALNEIEEEFLTPKLLRQLVSALICRKDVCQAGLVLYHCLLRFPFSVWFEDLLIHLDKWYVPHVEALLEICKEERFGESQDSSTKEQIDRICSDVVYPDDIELNEKRVKKDFSNFRSWRCIVPDEYESEIIRAEGECQSPIVPNLQQVVTLANSSRFNEAARECVNGFEAATSDEDHVILKYSRAMMLLLTKSIPNVEEGFKELQELLESDRMDWKSEFPAIYYGLGKYELALNTEHKFLNVELDEQLDPMRVPYNEGLKAIFPEMNFEELKETMMNVLRNSPNVGILATCRSDFCKEVFDRSEKGILGWKQTIKIDDVDYKGFTRMTCTDRCVIDFHPWCWKYKKDSEKCHLDKDYLKTYCPTPDCGAPIRQISLYKDDLENPYSLTDEEMTKKMLAEGKPKGAHGNKSSPTHKNKRDTKLRLSENGEEFDEDQPIEIRLENANKEIELKENNLKSLQKQLKDLQKESDSTKRELEKTKATNKRLLDENKQLKESHAQSQNDLKTRNQMLTRQNEALENNSALGMIRRDEELCKIVLKETHSFKNFVEAINMHLMPDSLELPRIYGQLADRQEKAEQILAQQARFRKPVEIENLTKVVVEPNWEKLKDESIVVRDIRNSIREDFNDPPNFSIPPPVVDGAKSMMSAPSIQQNPGRSAIVSAKAKKTKFMAVMELAKPLFPNLTDIQIIEYVDRVKKKFGTLKGKTNDEIIQEMCKFMQAEENEYECSICLTSLRETRDYGAVKKLECGHEYHINCIGKWFEQKRDCPQCRNYVVPKEEYPALGAVHYRH